MVTPLSEFGVQQLVLLMARVVDWLVPEMRKAALRILCLLACCSCKLSVLSTPPTPPPPPKPSYSGAPTQTLFVLSLSTAQDGTSPPPFPRKTHHK